MKKVYIAISEYEDFIGENSTITGLLTDLNADGFDPAEVNIYECVKGTYVPPQGEATVLFGSDR